MTLLAEFLIKIFYVYTYGCESLVPECQLMAPEARNVAELIARDGLPIIHLSAHYGDIMCTQTLIACGADVKVRDVFGNTLLHAACQPIDNLNLPLEELDIRQTKIAYLLLQQRLCDPNATNAHGMTPLHCAVSQGFFNMTQLLLQNGANMSKRDNRGETALYYMFSRATWLVISDLKSRMLKLLLDYILCNPILFATQRELDHQKSLRTIRWINKVLNTQNIHHGFSALHRAVLQDVYPMNTPELELMQMLLNAGANPNILDFDGNSPLQLLLQSSIWHHGRDEKILFQAVKSLLEAGADPNVMNKANHSPLHATALLHDEKIFSLLLAFGANPHLRNKRGETPEQLWASFP